MDTIVLGGQGYVAGELLRLLCLHPTLTVQSVVSTTSAGEPIVNAFGHLSGTSVDGLRFSSFESLLTSLRPGTRHAVFTATPHGSTATLVDRLLTAAEEKGARLHVVDLSADFRFRDARRYEAVYGQPHAATSRLASFTCAIPELSEGKPAMHAVQPGCFVTAATLAAYPFVARGWVGRDIFVSAITGSSGSGRSPGPGTHHPSRRSNLYAYKPLSHRHEAEMRMFLSDARHGDEPNVEFVPHSGPFVRGIHATVRMTLQRARSATDLIDAANETYATSPFVSAGPAMPCLSDVIGTNRCQLGIAVREETLVVTSVIDNLVKGAAGGAVQWMNRILDLPDDTGLRLPGLGWL